jgi:ABC-type branched-subunit amino acid transport system substrate-binding protein
MKRARIRAGSLLSIAVVVGLAVGLLGAGPASGRAQAVRGFDGTTITLASMGIGSFYTPGVPNGVQARIKAFNDGNEIKGIKLKYAEFADDKQDPATSLSEARRLVTQVGVFALVGDVSQTNPGDYFAQQQVPYFGWAFDNTYCSPKPSTKLWGFGFDGCLVPAAPTIMGANGFQSIKYVSQQSGKKSPTLSIFSTDSESGKNSVKYQSVAYQGAGYKVVQQYTQIPLPPVSDYTPYATALMTADNGNPPDAMLCLLGTDCIPIFNLVKAQGYKGTYISSLYSDALVKALDGSTANTPFVPLDTPNSPGLETMKKQLDAYSPGASQKIDSGTIAGYTSTDMFIQALKTVAKKGKSNITPANVQKTAANQTWEIKGLAGPTTYPQSTVSPFPTCTGLTLSDGTTWKTVEPYACSKQQYKVK